MGQPSSRCETALRYEVGPKSGRLLRAEDHRETEQPRTIEQQTPINPNMENTTLIQNNGGGRAPVKIQLKPTVKDFIAAVQLGVDAWEKAGEILVALINEDATIKKQIIDAAPWMRMRANTLPATAAEEEEEDNEYRHP